MKLLQTLHRAYRLTRMLVEPPRQNLLQLSKRLDLDDRSVRRYLHTLEEFGYDIQKDRKGRYFIPLATHTKTGSCQNHFPSKKELLLAQSRDLLIQQRLGVIQNLATAIEEQQQVSISYYSPSEEKNSERIVEPYNLYHEEKYLLAYEPAIDWVRPFKIDRIEKVEVLDQSFCKPIQEGSIDMFGWAGQEKLLVKLKISPLAYRLLIEEYPHCRAQVKKESNAFILETHVYDYKGVGRFVMGLLGEVEIVESEGLKEYVRGAIRKGVSLYLEE